MVFFKIKNTGYNCNIKITDIEIISPYSEYIDVDLYWLCEGMKIKSGKCKWGFLTVGGIPQLPEAQNAEFTFEIIIHFEQYFGGCP